MKYRKFFVYSALVILMASCTTATKVSRTIAFNYPTGEKHQKITYYDNGIAHVKTWSKAGKLIADGQYDKGKELEGTIWLYDYKPIVIGNYSNGKLISTVDLNGKKIDISKCPKKTEDELVKEGLIIKLEAKFE